MEQIIFKPTIAFRAKIRTAPLSYIMRITSELLVVPRATCGVCLKDAFMDERDVFVSVLALIFNQSP